MNNMKQLMRQAQQMQNLLNHCFKFHTQSFSPAPCDTNLLACCFLGTTKEVLTNYPGELSFWDLEEKITSFVHFVFEGLVRFKPLVLPQSTLIPQEHAYSEELNHKNEYH